tara:strand:+ start:202 stop:657 length:456 start_codon:yes stop_codon:yes gene_type:complete
MVKGIWLYGLSGAGKTFISKEIYENININKIIIDGDQVRKYISHDLGYSKKNRDVQISRLFGIAKISIGSKIFPIISSVWMNKDVLSKCRREKILVIKIEREMKTILNTHKTYKFKKDVVGKDIKYDNFRTKNFKNKKGQNNWKIIKKLIG